MWPLPSMMQAVLSCACFLTTAEADAWLIARADSLRIATLGTSLTAKGGWQDPLAVTLESCLERPVEVSNYGRSGATSNWGLMAVGKVAASRPDIAFVEFVANDAALNKLISPMASTANTRAIVQAFRAENPKIIIYLMTMNPFSGRRSWMRPLRERYEQAYRELATELRLGYLDHRPAWYALSRNELDLAIADGLHPTPSAAAAIIVPNIVQRMKDEGFIRCTAAAGARS